MVVLACSGREAGAMVDIARGLIATGFRVDVVAGVDLDARPLELATETHKGPALYVLCKSDELDDYQLELLVLTVRSAEVKEELIATLSFDPAAPVEFAAKLRARLLNMGWLREPEARPAGDTSPMVALAPADVRATASDAGPWPRRLAGALVGAACLVLGTWAFGAQAEDEVVAPSIAVVDLPEDGAGEHVAAAQPEAEEPEAAPTPASSIAGRPAAMEAMTIVATPSSEPKPPLTAAMDDIMIVAPTPAPAPEAAPAVAITPPAPPPLPDAFASEVDIDPTNPSGALERRLIRGLDALLVAVPKPAGTRSRKAASVCNTLEVAGVEAWRLPTVPELVELGDAGFLARDTPTWAKNSKKKTKRARWTGERVLIATPKRKTEAGVVCVAVVPA